MRATILAPATLATSIVGTENSFVTVSVTVSAPAVTVETEVVVVVDVTVAVVVDTKVVVVVTVVVVTVGFTVVGSILMSMKKKIGHQLKGTIYIFSCETALSNIWC